MAKGKMVFIGVARLKQLIGATGLKGKELEKLFGVSHAGFYKWQTKGIIPSDKLGYLLALNKFSGYEVEANPKVGGDNRSVLDFKIKDFFNTDEHLYIEAKPTDKNLEAVRMQIDAFKVPITLLYLSNGEIKMEENAIMRQRLSGLGTKIRSTTMESNLASESLDDLISEIENRGWIIKLERRATSSIRKEVKLEKNLKKRRPD
jgi:hypothetical protein